MTHTVATEPRVDDAIAIEEAAAEADHAMSGGEAEATGIQALRDFAAKLRHVRLVQTTA